MKKKEIYLGENRLEEKNKGVKGTFVEIENEKFYKISNYDEMDDFFMTIVSNSDHWMFISSNGSLSAGRKDRDNALFPYSTVDKIHNNRNLAGNKTTIQVERDNKTFLWEPFYRNTDNIYHINRNIYKSIYGNKVIFEEINNDLGLKFRYAWFNSEKYGFIKKSEIENQNNNVISLEILDGFMNIAPYGVGYDFYNAFSNLLDAYKKNELLADSNLGLFTLSSIPVDRPEPSESLKATSVWAFGFENPNILLSDRQLNKFRVGHEIQTESDIRAARGCYFVNSKVSLQGKSNKSWFFVADINQDSASIRELNERLIQNREQLAKEVTEDIKNGTINLSKIVAKADGFQASKEDLSCSRHYSNTMYNVMRGGIFIHNYTIHAEDFKLFVNQVNTNISKKFSALLNEIPDIIQYQELNKIILNTGSTDLQRIFNEYMPLTFSRRHGDPSRPWNLFSIETKNKNGTTRFSYEGNWRDIFQNWEALAISYPDFIGNMISKFLNASTPDGYNPYRIARSGIDWECPDPHDPWAFIGYWGDHQIVYLQKFLELSKRFNPLQLEEMLTREIFVYANVPYRIKSYQDIIKDPKDTIDFDYELNDKIVELAKTMGADARMLMNENKELYKVNLAEKILVTLLSKLSNFIPEAGIWLNTQRPEWNDANNALVGNGVSMVTLYYLRRFLKFWSLKFKEITTQEVHISSEVVQLFHAVQKVFEENKQLLNTGFSDKNRRQFMDALGNAGSDYRNSIYTKSFSGDKKTIKVTELSEFADLSLGYLDQSIRANKRENGLYHAYNLISIKDESVSIRYLYEMLEGQVAVLSSGYLSTEESLDVLNSLKWSKLFRRDQYSYILYPDRELPRFIEKNNIPEDSVKSSKLLQKLIENADKTVVIADNTGKFHYNGEFRNANNLKEALEKLPSEYSQLVKNEKESILAVFEEMFDHQSFTGRSGTFFGFEGLGSIYWHMVSKLLLATQESYYKGVKENANEVTLGKIKDHYYEIKAGIGVYKSPDLYGAFPIDAYSHTPEHAGVKQPGMTGQVKEDFISRISELGLLVHEGEINFNTSLLNKNEILTEKKIFTYFDNGDNSCNIELNEGQLAYTFCQIPIVYTKFDKDSIKITFNSGETKILEGNRVDAEISKTIFKRVSNIARIDFYFKN